MMFSEYVLVSSLQHLFIYRTVVFFLLLLLMIFKEWNM